MAKVTGLSLLRKLETRLKETYGKEWWEGTPEKWKRFPLSGLSYAEGLSDGCYNDNSPVASSEDVLLNVINKFYYYYEAIRDILEENYPHPKVPYGWYKIVIEPCYDDTSFIVIFDTSVRRVLFDYSTKAWAFVWDTPEAMAKSMLEDYQTMKMRLCTPTKLMSVISSHGELVIDENGNVLKDRSHYSDDALKKIVRFDLAEYRTAYPNYEGDTDILDIGYWMADGKYEPPEPEFRSVLCKK
jgi:hypothetical protein